MNRIRETRLLRGLSQADLAGKVGVSRQAIGQYESNERRPGGEILVRLAQVLGVSSAYLVGMTDASNREEQVPAGWEQVVDEAKRAGFTPEDLRRALRMLRMALGKDEEDR